MSRSTSPHIVSWTPNSPAFILGLVTLAPASMAQPAITGLGVLPGGSFSSATAISADGGVVTGTSGSAAGLRAFRWTAGGGMQSLGVLPGFTSASSGQAISADGAVIACISTGSGSTARACRWTSATGLQSLGVLGTGSASYARAISADGSVVAGSSYVSGFTGVVAVRWTAATGMQALGGSTAAAIVPGGSVIAGTDNVDGYDRAAFWTAPGIVQHLGNLSGADSAEALAINSDGSVAAGYSGDQLNGTFTHAVRWTNVPGGGSIEDLGTLAGSSHAHADAVNGDGSIIGGACSLPDGDHAFLWTAALGMIDLNIYLPSRGVVLTGWQLQEVSGISADGSSIVGFGTLDSAGRGWIVTGLSLTSTPCYANCDASTTAPVLNILDFTCFLNQFAAGSSNANCDHSTTAPVLNVLDFTCFLNRFAAGCS